MVLEFISPAAGVCHHNFTLMSESGKAGPHSMNDVHEQIDDFGRNGNIGTDHFGGGCGAKFSIPYLQRSETGLICPRKVTGGHFLADLELNWGQGEGRKTSCK